MGVAAVGECQMVIGQFYEALMEQTPSNDAL
jgi:hypothetical protein